jgi:tetratricopeptide (TPR) repeat protein
MFAFQLKGMLALYSGAYEEAVAEFQNANQQNPVVHFWTAQAYDNLGNNDKAQEFYRRAAYANSLNNFNYAYIRQTALENIDE